MAKPPTIEIEAGGITVVVSNPDKVLFGRSGITKGELARYYATVGPTMIEHLGHRPITLVRHPSGIDGEGFFQKNTPKHYPDWIPRVELPKKGGVTRHAVVDHPAALVYFAQQNVITPHIGLARADDLDHPDLLVVDLDPSTDDLDQLRATARAVGAALDAAGLVPFLQLTGSKGVHVVTPLAPATTWADVHRFSTALATRLLEVCGDDLTTEFSKAERGDRIYLDLGRNNPLATFAAPYGVRAYEQAPVVTPIEWAELDEPATTPRSHTLTTVPGRLADRGDPWIGMRQAARAFPA